MATAIWSFLKITPAMRIWIDFINTPQVSFFVPFIAEFKRRGYTVILTCRDSANTVDILRLHRLPFKVIGRRAGKGRLEKALIFPWRTFALWRYVRHEKPDLAIGQSSFYMPLVAKLLGIPSIYTNDNEYASGNLFGFVFASRVLLPELLQKEMSRQKWPMIHKTKFYPGIKEAIYLSQNPVPMPLQAHKSKIYFRPEPVNAEYYHAASNASDQLLSKLARRFQVVVLPRDAKQAHHYNGLNLENLKVLRKPISLSQIVADCLLFIGAGGSMNRELAVLGVPVISVYGDQPLKVDEYLVRSGRMRLDQDISIDLVERLIKRHQTGRTNDPVIEDGIKSYHLILEEINQLAYA